MDPQGSRRVLDVVHRRSSRDASRRGDDVAISGFAKFRRIDRPARMARNPATGEQVKVKAKRVARITPLKNFKDAVLSGKKAPGQEGAGQEGSRQEGRGQEGSGQEDRRQEGSGQEEGVAKRRQASLNVRDTSVITRTSPGRVPGLARAYAPSRGRRVARGRAVSRPAPARRTVPHRAQHDRGRRTRCSCACAPTPATAGASAPRRADARVRRRDARHRPARVPRRAGPPRVRGRAPSTTCAGTTRRAAALRVRAARRAPARRGRLAGRRGSGADRATVDAGVAIGPGRRPRRRCAASSPRYVERRLPQHQVQDRTRTRRRRCCARRGPRSAPTCTLAADANGSYTLADARRLLAALDDLALQCIEQPLAPDALADHARSSHELRTPIGLDETITERRGRARRDRAPARARDRRIKVGRLGDRGRARACTTRACAAGVGALRGRDARDRRRPRRVARARVAPGLHVDRRLSASSRYFGADGDLTEPFVLDDGQLARPDRTRDSASHRSPTGSPRRTIARERLTARG